MAQFSDNELKQERRVLLCVALAAFIFQFEALAINISLPTITRDFKVTSTSISFVVLAYLLAAVSTLLPAGKLGGRLGLKKTFLAGCGIAMLGTLCCGLSSNFYALIACRFIQGVGAGTFAALGYVMIPAWVRKDRIGWGYGYLNMAAGIGMLVGVPIGGVLVEFTTWRWIFFSSLPLLGFLVIAAWRDLPMDSVKAGDRQPLDIPGAILLSALLITILFGLSLGSEIGWESLPILSAFATSAISAAALWRWLLSERSSLISTDLLRRYRFVGSLFVLFLVRAVLGGANFLMPFYLEVYCGLSALYSSVVVLACPLAYAAIGPQAGLMADRIGSKPLVIASTIIGIAAFGLFAALLSSASIGIAVAFLLAVGLSMGLFSSPNSKFSIESAPNACRNEAATLIPVALNMGTAFGISFFETVFSFGFPNGNIYLKHLGEFHPQMSIDWISRGFSDAFFMSAGFFLLAAVITLLGYRIVEESKSDTEIKPSWTH
jgi:MFS family permease